MSSTALTLQIGGDISRLRAEMLKATGLMNSFSSQLRGVGAQLGLTFGAAGIFMGLKHGVKVIGDFSHAMQEVRSITNATDKEFESLKNNALELGRTTKFTAKEVAELQIAFGRLGFSNQEILDSTAATLQLAAATGEDLAKSADIAGSTLRAFNLDASEMQRVVDVMASSFNKSALGLDNFGEAIKYVAPVAAAANISLEETTAMLGVLADAGIRGSMAGTSLRKIISDVKDESGTLSERLQKLAEKGMNGAEAMDEVGRTAYASLLILTKHIEKVGEAEKAYQNATGEAQKMADLMEDDLWGDIQLLTSALDGLILKFSSGEGPIRELTQGITELITLLSDDKVIKFMKEWFALVTIVPRKTLDAIQAIKSALHDEGDAFKKMQADRRKIWEQTMQKQQDDAIKTTNEARVAVEAYAQAYRSLRNAVGFSAPEVRMEIPDTSDDFWHRDIDMDPSADLMRGINVDDPVPGIVAEQKAIEGLIPTLDELKKKREEQVQVMERTAGLAETMGTAIGTALGEAAAGTKTFAETLQSVVPQIIKMLAMEAIASIIAAGAKQGAKSGNAIVGVAAAAIGAAAIGAMFSSIGGKTGGSGGGQAGRTPSEMKLSVGGRVRGYDLALVGDKESYRRSRMG